MEMALTSVKSRFFDYIFQGVLVTTDILVTKFKRNTSYEKAVYFQSLIDHMAGQMQLELDIRARLHGERPERDVDNQGPTVYDPIKKGKSTQESSTIKRKRINPNGGEGDLMPEKSAEKVNKSLYQTAPSHNRMRTQTIQYPKEHNTMLNKSVMSIGKSTPGINATGGNLLAKSRHAVNKSMDFQEPLQPDDAASFDPVDLNSSSSSREGAGNLESEIRAQEIRKLKVADQPANHATSHSWPVMSR